MITADIPNNTEEDLTTSLQRFNISGATDRLDPLGHNIGTPQAADTLSSRATTFPGLDDNALRPTASGLPAQCSSTPMPGPYKRKRGNEVWPGEEAVEAVGKEEVAGSNKQAGSAVKRRRLRDGRFARERTG